MDSRSRHALYGISEIVRGLNDTKNFLDSTYILRFVLLIYIITIIVTTILSIERTWRLHVWV